MARGPDKPKLSIVEDGATGIAPPRKLGRHGSGLWNRIHSETVVEDAGSLEILALAAATLDRAEGLAARIKADGEVIQTRSGPKAHPAIRDETQCRALVARLLIRLGLLDQPVKAIGRPAGSYNYEED